MSEEIKKWVDSMSGLASYAMTCRKNNTHEWMVGLVEKLQQASDSLGHDNKFMFDGDMIYLKIGGLREDQK